jgi:uncharacterized repeat protein (TIGR02543 family)
MTEGLSGSQGIYLGLTNGQAFERYVFSGGVWVLAGTATSAYFAERYNITAKNYFKTWIAGTGVDVTSFPAPGGIGDVALLKLVDATTCRIRSGYNSYTGIRTFRFITPAVRKILPYQQVAPGGKLTKPSAQARTGYTTDDKWYTYHPDIPDNPAGTVYRSNFSSGLDGWVKNGNGNSAAASGGNLVITQEGGYNWRPSARRAISGIKDKIVIIKFKASFPVTSCELWDGTKQVEIPVGKRGDVYIATGTGSDADTLVFYTNPVPGDAMGTVTISDIYVGDGTFAPGSIWDFARAVSSDNITLYARWIPIVYSVTYTLNGGTQNPANPAEYTIESPDITLAAPTRTGYTFGGWYTNAAFSGSPVTSIPLGSIGDVSLYAKWQIIAYTLTWNRNGGSGDNNPSNSTVEETVSFANPSRAGYTFGGWYDNASFSGSAIAGITAGSIGDRSYWAKWNIITYTISYTLNGGSGGNTPTTYTIETATITLGKPTRTGYTFEGWYTSAALSGAAVTTIPLGSYGNKTFYAKWEVITYIITCVLNGGTDPAVDATYTIESPPVPLHPSTRRGYDFMGWFDNAAFSGAPITGIPAGSIGDRSYWAKWQVIVYTISYTLNGGAVSPENPATYTVESPNIVFNAPTRRGYAFVGWYDNSDFRGSPDTGIPAGSIGDRAYYACWNLIVYRIAYELSGGTNSHANPAEYTVVSSSIFFQDAERRGYAFEGWYDTPDFSGAPVTGIPHDSIGDVALWAKWEAIIYPVEYVLSGGENNADNPPSYTVESPDIPLLNPERPGYSFAGWFDNAGFIDAPITRIPAGSTGALKFFARWTRGVTFPTGREKWDRFSGDPALFIGEETI